MDNNYRQMYIAVKVAASLSDKVKEQIQTDDLGHLLAHLACNMDTDEITEFSLRNKLFEGYGIKTLDKPI